MLEWMIVNNVISKLFYKNKNIIKPWGIETADSSSFFSLEKGVGWRNFKMLEEYNYNEKEYKSHIIAKMHESSWELFIDDKIEMNSIIRRAEMIILEKSFLMDFVIRYRFKKQFIKYTEISGKRYYHNNTNVYYQYSVDKVFLQGEDFGVNIQIIDKVIPKEFEPVIYVRDNNDEWVVHIRLVPINWEKEVIKICTNWAGTRPMPQFLSNFLLSFEPIKKTLWYKGERNPYRNEFFRRYLNLSAFAMAKLDKQNRILLNCRIDFI